MTENRFPIRPSHSAQVAAAACHFFGLSEPEGRDVADALTNQRSVRIEGPFCPNRVRQFGEYCEQAGYLIPR